MIALVVQHHPHRALAHFRRKLVRRLVAHNGPYLSGVGASGKPGAVQIDELSRRLKAARALKSMPNRSRYDVELAAAEAGVHPSTLYRDIGRLEGRGTIEDIAPRGKGWPEGRSKLLPRQEELIE